MRKYKGSFIKTFARVSSNINSCANELIGNKFDNILNTEHINHHIFDEEIKTQVSRQCERGRYWR